MRNDLPRREPGLLSRATPWRAAPRWSRAEPSPGQRGTPGRGAASARAAAQRLPAVRLRDARPPPAATGEQALCPAGPEGRRRSYLAPRWAAAERCETEGRAQARRGSPTPAPAAHAFGPARRDRDAIPTRSPRDPDPLPGARIPAYLGRRGRKPCGGGVPCGWVLGLARGRLSAVPPACLPASGTGRLFERASEGDFLAAWLAIGQKKPTEKLQRKSRLFPKISVYVCIYSAALPLVGGEGKS